MMTHETRVHQITHVFHENCFNGVYDTLLVPGCDDPLLINKNDEPMKCAVSRCGLRLPGTGCTYFRVPSDVADYSVGDSRSVPRHSGRVNTAFFDGHAAALKNSAIGYHLLRTDGLALWPRNHNGLVP